MRKSIKDQFAATIKDSKIETEQRLNQLDLDERINRAEAVTRRSTDNKAETSAKKVAERVIRDSFTMLASDARAIKAIKQKCLKDGIEANKSLILRAGIKLLDNMPTNEVATIIDSLEKAKIGRPKD